MITSLQTSFAGNNTITDSETISSGLAGTGDGGTLFLTPGTYNKTGDIGITISQNITIQGNGPTSSVIIDARRTSGIFIIGNNTNVIFINITFANARTSREGGAVYNQYTNSALTFINCSFINNSAGTTYGGAISNYGHNMIVSSSSFMNNNGSFGAAIYNRGENISIINSIFSNNNASSYGGAISNYGINMIVNGSNFNNNYANNVGGAIANYANKTMVLDSNFFNNTVNAGTGGGAFYNQDAHNVIVIGSNFTNNKVVSFSGGAIYNYNSVNLTITSSNFINNTAMKGWGGALYCFNGNAILQYNRFLNNNDSIGKTIYNNGGIVKADFNWWGSNNDPYTLVSFITILNWVIVNVTPVNPHSSIAIFKYTITTSYNSSSFIPSLLPLFNVIGISSLGANGIFDARLNQTLTLVNILTGSVNYNFTIDNQKFNFAGAFYQHNTNSTIIIPNNVKVGQKIYISGLAYALNGDPLDNALITIIIGNETFNLTVINGEWYFLYTPTTSGNILISVSWEGNSSFIGFTNNTSFNVDKLQSSLIIIEPSDVTVGQTITFMGVLTDENGKPIANAQINLDINGINYIVFTNIDGKWAQVFTPTTTGSLMIFASFAGDNIHAASFNTSNFNVLNETTNNNDSILLPPNVGSDGSNNKSIALSAVISSESDSSEVDFNSINDDTTNNNSSQTLLTHASMKKTGIPVIGLLLVLISLVFVVTRRK